MTIYERIKSKADEAGISLKALEKEVGLGNGIIKKWEKTSPQCNKLEKVANYLQVSIEWLITGKEKENITTEEENIIKAYRKADSRAKQMVNLSLEPYMEIEKSSELTNGEKNDNRKNVANDK